VAIRICGVGKCLGAPVELDGAARPRQAWRTLLRIAGLRVPVAPDDSVQNTDSIRADVLRDVSVDIDHGSVVCLTGDSEAATVLLQILAGVVPPTTGSVEIHGIVTSLLAVGDNLDARRTAEENIRSSNYFVNASPDEAERYAADVIQFAELQGFEHVPLRTYSTGMRMRLSVALALCRLPSIGLIDDVLVVGDIAFRQKCVDRLRALKQAGCTLVLAFSDEVLVRQVATRVITLGDGRIVGDVTAGGWMATRQTMSAADVEWQIIQNLPEDDAAALRAISVAARPEGEKSYLDLTLAFEIKSGEAQCRPSIILMKGRTYVFRSLYPQFLTLNRSRRLTFTVSIPTHTLSVGEYTLTVAMMLLRDGIRYSLKARRAVSLTIGREGETSADTPPAPVLAMAMPWEIEVLAQGSA
jgi:ABC-type polysaccharide/polyol phosphate transport system ATPase subunit